MIFIAADHGGFNLKKKIVKFLEKEGWLVGDLGPFKFNPGDDYPDYGFALGKKVALKKGTKGVLLCLSGIGMSVVANKVKGVRAALCLNPVQAQKAREHNDANVLVLAADFTSLPKMKKIIKKFLETKFSGSQRHKRRLKKIEKFEQEGRS